MLKNIDEGVGRQMLGMVSKIKGTGVESLLFFHLCDGGGVAFAGVGKFESGLVSVFLGGIHDLIGKWG